MKRVREVAHWLRAFTTLLEDADSMPRSTWCSQPSVTSVPWVSVLSPGLKGYQTCI